MRRGGLIEDMHQRIILDSEVERQEKIDFLARNLLNDINNEWHYIMLAEVTGFHVDGTLRKDSSSDENFEERIVAFEKTYTNNTTGSMIKSADLRTLDKTEKEEEFLRRSLNHFEERF